MSNSLDPDQAGHFVRPDLDPNCLQSLSAGDTISQCSFEYVIGGSHLSSRGRGQR